MIYFGYYSLAGVWLGLPIGSYFDDLKLIFSGPSIRAQIGVKDSDPYGIIL